MHHFRDVAVRAGRHIDLFGSDPPHRHGGFGRRRERRNRHDDFRQRYLHRVEGDVHHGGVRCRDQERFGGDRVESFGGDIQCVVSHRDAADQEQPVAVRRSRESVAREPHGDACDRPVVAAAGHAALDGARFRHRFCLGISCGA